MFWKLGRHLQMAGANVLRIHICPGDGLFWPFWKASAFRGRFPEWAGFFVQYVDSHRVTDIIMFGECRPYHRVALQRARRRGIRVHIFDEGLVRPHWVTMIEAGKDWREGSSDAFEAPPAVRDVAGGLARRVRWDVAFHIVNTVLSPLFPFYRRHRPGHPLREAQGWLTRLAQRGAVRLKAEAATLRLRHMRRPYFLVPLQLDSDAQIRFRSPFANMGDMLSRVMTSFADNAAPDAMLVIKVHPLDNGVVDRPRQIEQLAQLHGISERVVGLDGGNLDALLAEASGTVVVNSTVGLSAIRQGCPTKVLGTAFYDCSGLSSELALDDFWTNTDKPDPKAVEQLIAIMMAKTQINGSYFTGHGMTLAVDGIVRLLALRSSAR